MTTLVQRLAQLRGRQPARTFIVALVAVILIPALILAGYLASWSAQSERAQMEQSAINQTREATAAIDREVVATQNVLSVLADSALLQDGRLDAFYSRAKDTAQRIGFLISLVDRQLDRQVVNTQFPFGASFNATMPAPRVEAEIEMGRSRKPVVSNVFIGVGVDQPLVAIVVPVTRGDDVAYSLSAGVPVRRFADLLDTMDIAPGRTIGIMDRANIMVARSARHDEFAGTQITDHVFSESPSVAVVTNRDGTLTHWFSRRSSLTGWVVSVGVPDGVLEGPLRRAWLNFSIAGTLLLAVAVGLSYHWGGQLSRSMGALGIDREPTREEFEVLFDSAPNGVMVIGSDGIIMLVNVGLEKKFGYVKGELVGQSVELLVPERIRDRHLDFRRIFALNPEARPMGAGRELFGRRKDGSEFPVEIALTPITTTAGDLVLATVIDITARKLSERKLSSALVERDDLRRRFMQAGEQARLRLSHELHDQTGQILAAAMLELKGIEPLVEQAGREGIARLRRHMEGVGQTLHRVAWELRPASIDELGLASALENYISEWGQQYGVDADFYCSDDEIDKLPDDVRTTIYRVVQEGLTNVAKHARRASRVSVVVERREPGLSLMIENNGDGFEQPPPRGAYRNGDGGLGIPGMRERLALIGGDLEIESSVGGGTTVFARIPLEPTSTAA